MAHEQAQIDIVIEHDAVPRADRHMVEAAVFFVHAMLIAGEHHHFAHRWHGAQELGKFRFQPHDAIADAAGHQLRFADTDHPCRIAGPDAWISVLTVGQRGL